MGGGGGVGRECSIEAIPSSLKNCDLNVHLGKCFLFHNILL